MWMVITGSWWVLILLKKKYGSMTLYVRRLQYVSPLAHLLPSIMYNRGYFEHKERQVQVTPFACKRLGPDIVPQQRGAGHCGAFTLVFAEYIIAHKQKFDFNAKQMKALRKKMSIDIFANSTRLDDEE
ncbi:hypothetical protein ACOSQ2_020749 [Xanthoceras sorbifolium]